VSCGVIAVATTDITYCFSLRTRSSLLRQPVYVLAVSLDTAARLAQALNPILRVSNVRLRIVYESSTPGHPLTSNGAGVTGIRAPRSWRRTTTATSRWASGRHKHRRRRRMAQQVQQSHRSRQRLRRPQPMRARTTNPSARSLQLRYSHQVCVTRSCPGLHSPSPTM